MKEVSATWLIWSAIGKPSPWMNEGTPIKSRGPTGICAHCGEPAEYKLQDAISDNFTTVKNDSRAWPFGGDSVCAACVIACKWIGLRAGLWFARENGIWFVPLRPIPGCPETRPDTLSALLNPPEPPFVAGLPLYGIDHGAEANAGRIIWPGEPIPADPLFRVQSKHTAIYARVAYSRERYPLQVDDANDIVVDVPFWTKQIALATTVVAELRAAGVGAEDIRRSLVTMNPPPRAPISMLVRWREIRSMFESHCGAQWWDLVVQLLPMPALPEKEKQSVKPTLKSDRPAIVSAGRQDVPKAGQLSLAFDGPRD